jgi:stage V sporulation protein B
MGDRDSKFIQGALILTVAGFLVKILGAVYRIPLYTILGDEGMGLYQMAYPIYSILLTVSSSGLNVAISKVVAERWALNHRKGAHQAFRVSLIIMLAFGVLSAIGLYSLSGWIATNVARDVRSAVSIRAIAPALFFASVLSAFRGWFQGIEDMVAPAVSQVLEQLARIATMFLLARALIPKGLPTAAAGATLGAVVGAAAGMFYVWAVYHQKSGKWATRSFRREPGPTPNWRETATKIARIAVPISLASGAFGITQLMDLGLVPGRLQAGGIDPEMATALYGKLTGGAFPLLNITTVFTGALQVALVPSVSAAMVVNDKASAKRRITRALTLAISLALPAAVGVFALSEQIPTLLFDDPEVGPILETIAPGVLFLAIQQVSSGVLQGLGLMEVPLKNLLWAALVKGVITYLFVPIPEMGILAAGAATSAHFAVAGTLNVLAIQRELGGVTDLKALLKLLISSVVMGLVAVLTYRIGGEYFSADLSTVLAVGMGVLSYGVLVLITGAVKLSELKDLPIIGRFIPGGKDPR